MPTPVSLFFCTCRWAQQSTNSTLGSEDGDFETDRSPTQDDGTNRDLDDSGRKGRAPPPQYRYGEQTSFISSEHKTLEASSQYAAPQHAHNTDQTTLASSLLSPTCSTGPSGPPSGDGDRPPSDDGDGLHQQTLAGEAGVAELATSLLAASLPEHQAAASSLGASSSRLPDSSVGAVNMDMNMNRSVEGEGCDEFANLDARAGSLLEHCRQLLSAPPTDDAEQVFMMCCSAYGSGTFNQVFQLQQYLHLLHLRFRGQAATAVLGIIVWDHF